MENLEALKAIERGEKPNQDALLQLIDAKLVDVVSNMPPDRQELTFVGFTREGYRLLEQHNALLVSDLEKRVTNAVVRGFLDRHEPTSTRTLLKQFKSPIATALRRLSDRGVLQVVNNTYLNETYLPKALAFYHCGDSASLAFARKSTETVLRVLPILFDKELERPQGSDQRQFTSDEVANEACAIDSSVEPNAIFTGLFLAQEFSVFTGIGRDDKQVGIISFSLDERVYETRYLDWDDHIQRSNTSLVNDLEYAHSKSSAVGPVVPSSQSLYLENVFPGIDSDSNKVFLVHGHAEGPKQAVAAFLRSGGLEAIILHEQPNEGKTIIEKFEKHSDVGFAVVLLTPDDFGGPAGHHEKARPRARQNVVLELGYFMGKLRRNKVCCLYVEGVELPSDYQGVLWLPYDESGAWRNQLAKELSAAGIEFDSKALAAAAKKTWEVQSLS
jgi:hypothetical protein